MPPRKRRAPATEEPEDAAEDHSTPAPQRRTGHRRQDDGDSNMENEDGESYLEDAEDLGEDTSQQQMVKSLVRLALACEHSRIPLRRADISAKCLNGNSRQFKSVMIAAQLALRQTFGMDLVELPAKEKVTISQRRAAQKAVSQGTQSNSSKQWILVSILPPDYRDPEIMLPSKTPSDEQEAAYIGLYTIAVATIALYGAPIPEQRLERVFQRMNAAETTPIDRFDRTIERMIKNGYLVKIKDTSGGEETIEYGIGPRAKREIGSEGLAGLIRKVFGQTEEGAESTEEFEKKLEQSLRTAGLDVEEPSEPASAAQASGTPARRRGRPARGQT